MKKKTVNTADEQEVKERIPVWLYPSTIALMEKALASHNCKSKSEFIERAINFYSGYIFTQDSSQFLSKTLTTTMRGIMGDSENRIARLLFKLAVEISMMMNVLAATAGVDESTLYKLRGKCVEEVKKSNGAVTFDEAVRHQSR